MRPLASYANYSRSARLAAKIMDDLLAPVIGSAGASAPAGRSAEISGPAGGDAGAFAHGWESADVSAPAGGSGGISAPRVESAGVSAPGGGSADVSAPAGGSSGTTARDPSDRSAGPMTDVLPTERTPQSESQHPRGVPARRAGALPQRVLLVRPDHAGDLLMATPAFAALRAGLGPGATIDVLASPWGAPALAGNPHLDRVLTIEATWFEPGRREGPDPMGLLASLAALRRGRYDAAADLRGDFRSILLARASGAPRRAGFSGLGLEALLTDPVPVDPRRDFVSRNHAIVARLGAEPLGPRRPIFAVPAAARSRVDRLLSGAPGDRPLVALFPGANRPRATWGEARFAAACKALDARLPVRVVLGGREADGPACRAIADELRAAGIETLDLSGLTDLGEAAALIASAAAMLGNDSGAAHLAAAVGTPAVAVFGPTDPALLWTWEPRDRYVAFAGPTACVRPCFRGACRSDHGYADVDPRGVAAELERLIQLGSEDSE